MKDKGGKQLCLPFVGSNLWVEIFSKKREHHEKGALNEKIEASLYTLYWGLKKIPFTLYTYDLVKILQNGAKFIQKLTPGIKNPMGNLGNFRQPVESPKVEIRWTTFVQVTHPFS